MVVNEIISSFYQKCLQWILNENTLWLLGTSTSRGSKVGPKHNIILTYCSHGHIKFYETCTRKYFVTPCLNQVDENVLTRGPNMS